MPRPIATVFLSLLFAIGACKGQRPAVAAPPPSMASPFELAGIVRDEATGRPLAGVLIVADSLPGRRAATDAVGAYRIVGLPRGTYTVSARTLGYYIERREIQVSCPVTIVDAAGKPIAGGGACDADLLVLNFLLRKHTVY